MNSIIPNLNIESSILKGNSPNSLKFQDKYSSSENWTTADFTYDGKTVTGFSNLGRKKFIQIKDVTIPDTNGIGEVIVSIGDNAFLGDFSTKQDLRVGINSVKIPNTVKVIGKSAFRYNALKEITIPSGTTMIGQSAFNGNRIRRLSLPSSLIDLGLGAFSDNEISSLKLPSGMKVIPSAFAFNKLSNISIPDGVLRIDDYAFSDNLITSLQIPNSLKYLSGFNNNRLKSISIPASVLELGKKAFARNRMDSVNIPSNVRKIGESSFWNTWHDTFITSLNLEEGISEICDYAFSGNRLDKVRIPDSLVSLSDKAFYKNLVPGNIVSLYTNSRESHNRLLDSKYHVLNPQEYVSKKSVESRFSKRQLVHDMIMDSRPYRDTVISTDLSKEVIWTSKDFLYNGSTVTGLSTSGFEKLQSSRDIVIPIIDSSGRPTSGVGKGAFRGLGLKSVIFLQSSDFISIGESSFCENNLERIVLSKGLKEVETYAFCKNSLKHIEFPSTIKKIGNHAFAYNDLLSLRFSSETKDLSLDSFSFCGNKLSSVFIPPRIRKVHSESFRDNLNDNTDGKVRILTSDVYFSVKNSWFAFSENHRVLSLEGGKHKK